MRALAAVHVQVEFEVNMDVEVHAAVGQLKTEVDALRTTTLLVSGGHRTPVRLWSRAGGSAHWVCIAKAGDESRTSVSTLVAIPGTSLVVGGTPSGALRVWEAGPATGAAMGAGEAVEASAEELVEVAAVEGAHVAEVRALAALPVPEGPGETSPSRAALSVAAASSSASVGTGDGFGGLAAAAADAAIAASAAAAASSSSATIALLLSAADDGSVSLWSLSRRADSGSPVSISVERRYTVCHSAAGALSPAQQQQPRAADANDKDYVTPGKGDGGRGLHSSTPQLNLSSFWSQKPQQASISRLNLRRFCIRIQMKPPDIAHKSSHVRPISGHMQPGKSA